MPSQIFALFLILLAALPNFGAKINLQNQITTKLLGGTVTQNQTFVNKTPIMPYKNDPLAQAQVNAQAAYFVDYNTGEVLLAKNENQKLPMASTTKLMTAIIASEDLDQNKVLTVGSLNLLPLDSVMGLATGDKIKVSELMHGLLIESGADAAEVLANASAGNDAKFVAAMNEKASQFGLSNTQFANPVGVDDPNNFSTAKDLSALARIALSNKQIAQIVTIQKYTAYAQDGKSYELENTNQLLTDPNYKGVKTGTTLEAGQCLITLYDDGNRKILGVVLNSPDRFSETKSLVEWTKQVFLW